MHKILREVRRYIAQRTGELSDMEYAELMRSIAVWAEDQANLAEYGFDEREYDEEENKH